jgi:hypothetical protein
MIKARDVGRYSAVTAVRPAFALGAACATPLRNAKTAYVRAQKSSRLYRTDQAFASCKLALAEAGLEARTPNWKLE